MPLIAVALVLAGLLPNGFQKIGMVPSAASEAAAAAFSPGAADGPASDPGSGWVAPHAETPLWSEAGPRAEEIGIAHRWAPLEVVGGSMDGRLQVRDPADDRRGWVSVVDVGPVDPALAGTADVPPIGRPIAWSGPARVTMHTCAELGGCGQTASGLLPEPGMVAVDPSVIPLGSTVWIQGLGMFLATDAGSLVRGARLDVFGGSYQEAIAWGVQERTVLVFAPR
jgi:3D (Asp-Asp-Asp) domain-containing protein